MDFVIRLLEEVKRMIRDAIRQNEPRVMFGEVTSDSPLKIKVKDSYEIDEDFMVLDSRCVETWIKIPTDGNPKHAHTMEEALVDYQATGNMGAPIIFVPLGVEAYIDNPDFDPEKEQTDKDIPGTGSNPKKKLNPAVPNPTTLPLKHTHTIQDALEKICLWRGLKKGDKVKIVRIGSVHFVTERVEGITNDTDS